MVEQNSPEEETRKQPKGRLSAEAIREYKEIYKAEFGIKLSNAEAEEHGLRLLRLFALLRRPFPDEPKK